MASGNALDLLFVLIAFFIQLVLIKHFALRRWAFATAMRFGVLVYGLSIPAVIVSALLLAGGKPWYLWVPGILYLAWATYGYSVEYILHLNWRTPIRWSVLVPYVVSYLAALMFYWWPLATISRPLWYGYAMLFVVSTLLNILSHRGQVAIGG